jgi:hypothetical protein
MKKPQEGGRGMRKQHERRVEGRGIRKRGEGRWDGKMNKEEG